MTGRGRRLWRSVSGGARRALRDWAAGLVYLCWLPFGPPCPAEVAAEIDGASRPELPPGHPERLVDGVGPTATERALWAQLEGVLSRWPDQPTKRHTR